MSDIKSAKEVLVEQLENFRTGKLDFEGLWLIVLLLKSPESRYKLSLSELFELLDNCRYIKYKLFPQKPKEIRDYEDLELARWYRDALETYESDLSKFLSEWDSMKQVNDTISIICRKLICEEVGLSSIPEKAQDRVYNLAWEYGHSNGYMEVLSYLLDLVELFKDL